MKIRTDFVTNSSSSSFIVDIDFKLKNGSHISYHETGEDGEGDPVVDEIFIYSSPRELGTSKSVEDMINLLKSSVKDFPYDDDVEPKRLFDETHPETKKILNGEYLKTTNEKLKSFCVRQKKAHEKAQNFIKSLGTIKDMDEIEEITISGNERNYINYDRTYTYNLVTGDYTCKIKGEPFEKDGGSGGDLCFKDDFLTHGKQLKESDFPLIVPIEGTAYEGRIARIEHIKVGDELILKADFDNKFYDPVAIEVFNTQNETLGYLADDWEDRLKTIAKYLNNLTASVDSVTPLSARRKGSKYALMDVKLIPKSAEMFQNKVKKTHSLRLDKVNNSNQIATTSSSSAKGKHEGNSSNNALSGLTFVVTGDVHTFSSRKELKQFIEERGGKLSGSVSSKTNYLITNTPNSGTTKNRDARDLGVEIITEEQFRKMAE